jgi:hypothetical protein
LELGFAKCIEFSLNDKSHQAAALKNNSAVSLKTRKKNKINQIPKI